MLRSLCLSDDSESDGGIAWRESALASYEATVQAFHERMGPIMHITAANPFANQSSSP